MRGVSYLDISCAQAFERVILSLQERGVRTGCCGLSEETRKTMERSGILAHIGEENVFWSVDRALARDCT
jgi:SulP family sulfate permease